MRPKVVIIVMVVAFGLLGLFAMLKAGKSGGHDLTQDSGTNLNTAATGSNAVAPVQGLTGNTAPVSDRVRAAIISKEIEEIQILQGEVDGTNNPIIISALILKLSNSEADVRQAALDAIKQMNDTNAVPGLQQAKDAVKDPRQQVAIMDTIDYLNMPSITAGVSPDLETNSNPQTAPLPASKDSQMNSKFLHKASKRRPVAQQPSTAQQAVPPAQP